MPESPKSGGLGIKKMVHKIAYGTSGSEAPPATPPDDSDLRPVAGEKQRQQDPPHEGHNYTESYVKAIAHALVEQAFAQLALQRNIDVISKIIHAEADVGANYASTEKSRKIARTAASDAVAGSYDAVQKKWLELFEKVPYREFVLPGVAAIFVVYGVGLLLSLWRFALFGLH